MPVYFSKGTTEFLKELIFNNNREWFHQNKDRFQKFVEIPLIQFLNDLLEKIKELDPRIKITAKEAMFRIYKDIRFSKDKTPYKEFIAALISPGGKKDHSSPGLYFEIRCDTIQIYSGVYAPDSKQLLKIRKHIAANLTEFSKLIHEPNFTKLFGEILGEKNKLIPAQFKDAAEKQNLIYNKNFYYMVTLDNTVLYSNQLLKEFINIYKAARKLNVFFEKALNS